MSATASCRAPCRSIPTWGQPGNMKLQASQSVLTNGIRVVTCPAEHVESATIGLWVGVGGRHEPKSLCGASHFIEHLLFKGTRKRSARDISQAIEGRGGSFNAFTQEEFTCYYAWTAAEHAWQTLDILLDMYRRPRFATDDVEKEREVILEEMLMCRDRPDQLVQDMLTENLWPGHPLGRPLVGMEKTLLAMRRQHLLKFKNSRYVPGNTVLAFAGRLAHEDCVREAKRRLRGIHGAPAPLFPPAPPSSARDRIAIQKKNIAQIHLALGFRTFSRHDPRRHALKILNTILGDNMKLAPLSGDSRKHGMAYSIQSSFNCWPTPAQWS